MTIVAEKIASYEKGLGPEGHLGVSATLFDATGEVKSVVEFKADRLFPLASVVKLPVGMSFASQVELGHISNSESCSDLPDGMS